MKTNVGIYLYNQAEVLDFAGPFEVFSTASRVKLRIDRDSDAPFSVFTIGEAGQNILAHGGLEVRPTYNFNNHPTINLLIIPGGVVNDEIEKETVIQWIINISSNSEITASVCTGAFLLAKAGLLSGKSATTHWEDVPDFRSMFPDVRVIKNKRWIDEGKIVTSAGISAGIDMSLHLVSRFEGDDLAVKTAKQMEFDWTNI
ncbi:MAG: DJ-1/PfpI family protein [Spirochaetota bacterium]|nr:MAG: DJ-1/PfpI family protein [Spirochaetota bacterium]